MWPLDTDESPWRIPDALWQRIGPFLPQHTLGPAGGRPRADDRSAMDGIYFVLRTGCQWKALPRCYGASSTVYDRFREWERAGVFVALWKQGLMAYDHTKGLDWRWQSVDGCMTKAPLGGECTGPNPTDRAKSGTKRSLLTDGGGIPLAVVVSGANRHDKKMLADTLANTVVPRPRPAKYRRQHLCLDKGYDYPDTRRMVEALEYVEHIKARGQEVDDKRRHPTSRARRWVVERCHSWLNRFRRLLVRWEKRLDTYLALLHLACGYIAFRAAGVIG